MFVSIIYIRSYVKCSNYIQTSDSISAIYMSLCAAAWGRLIDDGPFVRWIQMG